MDAIVSLKVKVEELESGTNLIMFWCDDIILDKTFQNFLKRLDEMNRNGKIQV